VKICLALLLASFSSVLFADEAASLFQQGNQSYQAEDYQKALAAYERILQLGQENWQVYYNLGNACYKLRQPAQAILYYERAQRLNPDNEDIRFNLDLANLQVADHIPEPPPSAVLLGLNALLHLVSLEGSAMLALFFWIALCAALIMVLLSRKSRAQQSARRLAWGAGALGVVLMSLFGYRYYEQQTTSFGIIMEPRVTVRSAPAADATEVFILHAGTKARLETRSGGWQRIRLADGKVGWLAANAVAKI